MGVNLDKKIIDGDEYNLLSVDQFEIEKNTGLTQVIDSRLKEKKLTPIWNISNDLKYLEKISEFHSIAERLFKTKNVGIVVFINNSEQKVAIEEMEFNIGDNIEIAYIERDWEKSKQVSSL